MAKSTDADGRPETSRQSQTPFVLFLIGMIFGAVCPRIKAVPGGPFISLTGEVLPIIGGY